MSNPERIIRLKTVLDRTGLSGRRSIAKWERERFLLACRSASTELAGMSPPSTAGLPILRHIGP